MTLTRLLHAPEIDELKHLIDKLRDDDVELHAISMAMGSHDPMYAGKVLTGGQHALPRLSHLMNLRNYMAATRRRNEKVATQTKGAGMEEPQEEGEVELGRTGKPKRKRAKGSIKPVGRMKAAEYRKLVAWLRNEKGVSAAEVSRMCGYTNAGSLSTALNSGVVRLGRYNDLIASVEAKYGDAHEIANGCAQPNGRSANGASKRGVRMAGGTFVVNESGPLAGLAAQIEQKREELAKLEEAYATLQRFL